jgi:predicted RNA binding protein YcfA (HicA-like mRNA interferase family)
MNAKLVIKRLEDDGGFAKTQKSSHKQFIHSIKKGKVTVPIHGKDELPPKR